MLLRSARAILILSLILLSAGTVFAMPADSRLIGLVPPESQIVAGMRSQQRKDHLDSFLLITRGNRIDLQDFFAIVGADASRSVRQVVFVAANGESGVLSEHSLLASGHFNRDALYRMGDGGNATGGIYRGVPVLVVPAFAREAGKFDQVRWLAVIDEGVAIFGTVESVRRELDRLAGGAPPDPILEARLSRLASGDEAWCLLPEQLSPGLASTLARLDPKFEALGNETGPLEYGIHFGSRIEVTVSSWATVQAAAQAQNKTPDTGTRMAADLLSRSDSLDTGRRVVATVSRSRYEQWVAGNTSGLALDGGSKR